MVPPHPAPAYQTPIPEQLDINEIGGGCRVSITVMNGCRLSTSSEVLLLQINDAPVFHRGSALIIHSCVRSQTIKQVKSSSHLPLAEQPPLGQVHVLHLHLQPLLHGVPGTLRKWPALSLQIAFQTYSCIMETSDPVSISICVWQSPTYPSTTSIRVAVGS